MSQHTARDKWLARFSEALADGTFVKLTLASCRGGDHALKNVMVRPVELKSGFRLSFVYRYATSDVTKNFERDDAVELISDLIGSQFKHAHLFTTRWRSEIEFREGKPARLIEGPAAHDAPAKTAHDQRRARAIEPAQSPWLATLGVATADGKIAKGMEAKFRQINKFVELLESLLPAAEPGADPLKVVDMGCGKGYLTFATADFLRRAGRPSTVRGIEARPALTQLCQQAAKENGFTELHFETATIADVKLDRADVVIALHACDTATDDAIAKGIASGARLLLLSPCCHKELRPQIVAPRPLAPALRHGILLERHAELVTDALRAALLEWAGYDTKVFEFISTEHTGKNLMIAATLRKGAAHRDEDARAARELAVHHGIRQQQLARHLGFDLTSDVRIA